MNRRGFLASSAAAAATRVLAAGAESHNFSAPQFTTQDAAWQSAYDGALSVLAGNVRILPRYPQPGID